MHADDVQTRPLHDGAAKPDSAVEISADLLSEPLPRMIGDLELLSVLGRGGMGVVYLARNHSIDRLVAVKMIRDIHLTDAAYVYRLHNEARAAARLSHPHIVTVYELGEHDGQHFFSMDYIEGSSLDDVMAAGPIEPHRAARIVKTAADAIHCAHEHGVLHRDLKPANILLDKDGEPYVTDFGLAKNLGNDSGFTKMGTALGTPSFMPPEQASGRHDLVDRTSDVYALGAILYSLLTGQPPYSGATVIDTMMDVVHKPLPLPRTVFPMVDRRLETICLKCLEKTQAQRYATAAELADDLHRYLAGEPTRARPAGAASLAWHWWRQVPLVAALFGATAVQPTTWQRRANLALLAVPLIALVIVVAARSIPPRLPAEIRLASAMQGDGSYAMARAMAGVMTSAMPQPIRVLETHGSLDNLQHVLDRSAEVALLQENMLDHEAIAVVAPLAYEVVHILARRDPGITRLADLAGRRVALGPPGSDMRTTATMILDEVPGWHLGDREAANLDVAALATDPTLEGAIVTTNRQNPELQQVLLGGQFALLPLDYAITEEVTMAHPSFRLFTIRPGSIAPSTADHPGIPETNVRTLATINVFLVVRRDAADEMVEKLLEALYNDPATAERVGIIPGRHAALGNGFNLHPAARRFFQARHRKP